MTEHTYSIDTDGSNDPTIWRTNGGTPTALLRRFEAPAAFDLLANFLARESGLGRLRDDLLGFDPLLGDYLSAGKSLRAALEIKDS